MKKYEAKYVSRGRILEYHNDDQSHNVVYSLIVNIYGWLKIFLTNDAQEPKPG